MYCFFFGCQKQLTPASSSESEVVEPIKWNTLHHDFGDIPYEKPVTFSFEFTNQSKEAVKIDNVRVGCSCTVPAWTEEAIPPGATETIEVSFDAQKTRYFKKTIKVFFSKIPKAYDLTIEGYVQEPQSN